MWLHRVFPFSHAKLKIFFSGESKLFKVLPEPKESDYHIKMAFDYDDGKKCIRFPLFIDIKNHIIFVWKKKEMKQLQEICLKMIKKNFVAC